MSGVVIIKPAVVLGFKKAGQYPINTKGTVNVRVSGMNGKIVSGDLLTSSTTSGVAMKATKSGMVLGSAMGDYSDEDKTKVGKIPLFIDIRYAEIGAKDEEYAVKKSIAPWRIGLGASIALLSTVMCFYLYGKYTLKVVEAMARNPLAAKNLKRNMFIQGFFLLLFIGTGYFITYILLRG